MLTLHQLQTFLAVARAGSVHGAAERLVVSQPAVSAAIAAVQSELRVNVLERRGRGIRLTDAGREVERIGRRVIALLEELPLRAQAVAGQRAGLLRFGVVTTAAEHLVPALLTAFRKHSPDIMVDLEVANRARIWDRLEHGEIDLALGGRPPRDRAFASLATSANELIVVSAPGAAAGAALLDGATWLLREPGSGTRSAMEEFLTLLDTEPTRLTIGSNGAIRECVRAGLGMSLLPRDTVDRDVEAGTLVVIATPFTPISRPWHIVCNANEPLTSAATAFIEHACATTFNAGTGARNS